MGMNLAVHHLKAIVALADNLNFTSAAAELGVSQSALSRAIAEAERRLKTPLFLRSTRHVDLTPDGRAVVSVAREAVAQMEANMRHIEGYLSGQRGRVTIAALPSLAATLLPPVVHEFHRLHPAVDLRVEDVLSGKVADMVSNGEADVGLTADFGQATGIEKCVIAEDTFTLAVHRDNSLADAVSIEWRELAGVPLVRFSSGSSVARAVDAALADAGVQTPPAVQARNVAAVAGLVASGLGVAPVPAFVRPLMDFAGLHFVPLIPARTRQISLIRHHIRPMTPAGRAWVETLHRVLPASYADSAGIAWRGP
ncbi:LysR substrate-binding domain-containing protein [Micrococcus yunnanensis]|uniref:LysR family transcriptional regulator n=1 Tax=Micrococcus yunnanensis TaxID=566027 RepID=UPI00398E82ED